MKPIPALALVMSLVILTGCSRNPNTAAPNVTPSPTPTSQGPLRILVVDDSAMADALDREWRARSDNPLEISQQPVGELVSFRDSQEHRGLDTDVVVFPSRLLGELAEGGFLRQLPGTVFASPEFQQLDVFTGLRLDEVLWNQRPYAVPLGSPPLLLLTRREWVATPPSSWDALGETIARLRNELPEGVTPILQPTQNGWGANCLIARAATYWYDGSFVSTLFDYQTLKPKITTPPFVRALEELVRDANGSPAHTPATVLQAFLEGKTAMALCWPSAAHGDRDGAPVSFAVDVVELPGAAYRYDRGERSWVAQDAIQRVTVIGFSGRLAALSRTARNVQQATTLLGWAAGPEGSLLIGPQSQATTLFRKSHSEAAPKFVHPQLSRETAAQAAEVISRSLNRPELVHTLRIPHQHRYLTALDQAVQQAMRGELSPASALEQAAKAWEAITDEVGREQSQRAYRRSLGVPTP